MKESKKKVLVVITLCIMNIFILFTGDTFYGDGFVSGIVETEEKIADTGVPAGYLAYGSYVAYGKGNYFAYISGDTDTQDNMVDIYSNATGKKYYAGTFSPGEKITFTLDKEVSDLELRIYYSGTGHIEFEKVTIYKNYNIWTYLVIVLFNFVLFWAITCKKESGRMAYGVGRLVKLCSAAFMIAATTEYLRSARMLPVLDWIEHKRWVFALNFCVVCILITALYLCIRSIGCVVLLSGGIFSILAVVDYNYYRIRGEAFKLSEIALAGEAADVIGGYIITIPPSLLAILFLLVLGALALGMERETVKRDVRILGIAACALVFFVLYENVESVMKEFDADPGVYVTKNFYDNYGYIF